VALVQCPALCRIAGADVDQLTVTAIDRPEVAVSRQRSNVGVGAGAAGGDGMLSATASAFGVQASQLLSPPVQCWRRPLVPGYRWRDADQLPRRPAIDRLVAVAADSSSNVRVGRRWRCHGDLAAISTVSVVCPGSQVIARRLVRSRRPLALTEVRLAAADPPQPIPSAIRPHRRSQMAD
jgi:hypothetical protein